MGAGGGERRKLCEREKIKLSRGNKKVVTWRSIGPTRVMATNSKVARVESRMHRRCVGFMVTLTR